LIRVKFGLSGLAEKQVDNLVGDAVADLVRMPFGDGLAGKEIRGTRQEMPPGLIEAEEPCKRSDFDPPKASEEALKRVFAEISRPRRTLRSGGRLA
jgi:hypothetical protein